MLPHFQHWCLSDQNLKRGHSTLSSSAEGMALKGVVAWRGKDEQVPKAQPYDNRHLETFRGSLRD